jgi:hypothetical protein
MNTATATWDATANNTLGSSANGPEPYDFSGVSPTIVDGSVTVSDPLAPTPPLPATVSYTQSSPITINYSHTFSGDPAGTCTPHQNTASFATIDGTGTGDVFVPDQTGSDSQTVTVCVGTDLTVSKTATPAFTRTYKWKIDKAADKSLAVPGGTVNYTVTATETGFTDRGWKVTGTITVHNPNDFEAVALTGVSDYTPGGTCVVSGNKTQTVAASGDSTGLSYTCTFTSNPVGGTNTATAAWSSTAAHTPTGTANGTHDYLFGDPTSTVNKTITVTDTFNGTTTTLGTATATDTTPFTVQPFTYSHRLSPPSSGCTTVKNTATIVETGQMASASVKDCNTGALTIGYWQNKNGQAIITGANQPALTAWLHLFNPFQDYPTTAGQTLAQYVTNVIKAANASGSSMNAMLKAQDLATSLDVYFSDPALGGNKINAPVPIGGVVIDLTHICHMIDSTSGTATCSGTYENVSSAFGGATSRTVLQMLTYAASQSNVGGSTWYGQVKATQGLAKDAFDAINNQVATGP